MQPRRYSTRPDGPPGRRGEGGCLRRAAIRYRELHRGRIDRYLDAAEAWKEEARRQQRKQPDAALVRFLVRVAPLGERPKAEDGGRACEPTEAITPRRQSP
jgi:hypothetical protein